MLSVYHPFSVRQGRLRSQRILSLAETTQRLQLERKETIMIQSYNVVATTLAEGQTPPVKAFWSFSTYGPPETKLRLRTKAGLPAVRDSMKRRSDPCLNTPVVADAFLKAEKLTVDLSLSCFGFEFRKLGLITYPLHFVKDLVHP